MPERADTDLGESHGKLATLGVLSAIDHEGGITQRSLAGRLGIALGLTNAIIKRCVRKGLLKVQNAPARRYAYYLTPRGFQEKSRLTAQYLFASLDFFRHARDDYAATAEYCVRRGWTTIALYGASELAEIATISAINSGLRFHAVIDKRKNTSTFCGVPVVSDVRKIVGEVDAVIVTDAIDPQTAFAELCELMPSDRVLTPDLLHVTRQTMANSTPRENAVQERS